VDPRAVLAAVVKIKIPSPPPPPPRNRTQPRLSSPNDLNKIPFLVMIHSRSASKANGDRNSVSSMGRSIRRHVFVGKAAGA
jgi:hypothetical protein